MHFTKQSTIGGNHAQTAQVAPKYYKERYEQCSAYYVICPRYINVTYVCVCLWYRKSGESRERGSMHNAMRTVNAQLSDSVQQLLPPTDQSGSI